MSSGTTTAARPRLLPVTLAFAVMAAMVAVVPVVPAFARIALTILNVLLVVAYLMLRQRTGRFDWLEVIVPYSVLQILYFGVGALFLTYYGKAPGLRGLEPYITPALALSVVGFAAFLLSYALLLGRTRPSVSKGFVPSGIVACLVPSMLGLAGWLATSQTYRSIAKDLGAQTLFAMLEHFAAVFFFAWFLIWAVFWHDTRSFRNRLVVLAVTPMACVVFYLTLGSKENGITLMAFPVLAFGYVRGRFPIKSFVALVLILVFLIFPIYNSFRLQERALGSGDRLERSVQQLQHWNTDDYLDHSIFAFFTRLSVITSVAAILRDTGRWVDYAYGRTLILMPIGLLIPRFLWPEKPVLNVAREFGETFRLISAADRETNVAPTMIGELYWNFQIPAVLVGMFLLGAAYRWYYERFGRGEGYDPVRRSIYMALLPKMLHSEGSIAITMGGIIELLVLLTVLLFVFRRTGLLVPEKR